MVRWARDGRTWRIGRDAEVAWIEPLGDGVPCKYDVGLKFLHLSPENEALLAQVLE